MLTIGNIVKVNTTSCTKECPGCGYNGVHNQYNGMHGRLEEDALQACEKMVEYFKSHYIYCKECNYSDTYWNYFLITEHHYQVCFDGIHILFHESELEDTGLSTYGLLATAALIPLLEERSVI
jgi:hypothetical protein